MDNLTDTQIEYTLGRIKAGESLRGYPTNLMRIKDFVPQARLKLITELDKARFSMNETNDPYLQGMIQQRMDDIRTDLLLLQNLNSITIDGINETFGGLGNRIRELRTRDIGGMMEERNYVITPTTDIVVSNPDRSLQLGNLGGFGN